MPYGSATVPLEPPIRAVSGLAVDGVLPYVLEVDVLLKGGVFNRVLKMLVCFAVLRSTASLIIYP